MARQYLVNREVAMTDKEFEKIHAEINNTSNTVKSVPDDENYVYDFFIPREAVIEPFPNKWPKSKKTRVMLGGIDGRFYEKYKEVAELINFDTFWLYESARELDTTEFDKQKREFKYLATIMINRSKIHRRHLMKELDNFNLLGRCAYSFLDTKEETRKIWNKEDEQKTLPSQQWILDDYTIDKPYYEWKPPIELKQSLIQIVPETMEGNNNDDQPTFLTEKTWTPLLLGVPFLVCSTRFFHEEMEERFGIEMYDELFDYTFDSEVNMEARIFKLVAEVNKLKNKNYHKLFESVKDKVERNKKRVEKIVLDKWGIPNVESYFNNSWNFVVKQAHERLTKKLIDKPLV